MELRQLRHFVALAEEASFTKAADRELIVQSGLSSSIRTLERDVGSELFIRGSRPVRLTSAGRALLPAARRILQEADRGLRIVRDVSGLVSGPFSIGMIQIHAPFESCELVGWMATFAQEHAGLDISVRQLDRERTLALVAAGEMDCAVVHGAPASYPGLRIRRLASVPLALLAPLNTDAALPAPIAAAQPSPMAAAQPSPMAAAQPSPMAAAQPSPYVAPLSSPNSDFSYKSVFERQGAGPFEVSLRDLDGMRFVDTYPGFESRDLVDAAFAARGLSRRIGCEVTDLATVVELVRAGLGVALVPRNADVAAAGLRLIPLAGDGLNLTVDFVMPSGSGASPAALAFAERLTDGYLAHA